MIGGIGKIKKLSFAAALCALATPALATNLTVLSYSTPDGLAFNDVTTTATGAPDTPYSYYTGPIVFGLSDGSSVTVYCVDLNHFLASSGTYALVPLTENGEGQAISEADSNRIGWIAGIGARALAAGGTANLDLAAAAQAAIWDIAYAGDSVTSVTADPTISADLATLLGDVFPDRGYATAMQPFGVGWPDVGASQQMVIGFNAPEPSTWAMMLLGFAGLACAGYRSTHRGRSIAA